MLEQLNQQFETLIHKIDAQFGEDIVVFKPQAKEKWLDIFKFLHDNLGLHYLSFITGADLLDYLPKPTHNCRYELIYQFFSIPGGNHLRVKLPLPDDKEPCVPSATGVWKSAELLENEVYDMFGIRFEGHPDLRRMYMPEDWEGHPLRKDYPLKGTRPRGEKYQR